MEFVLFVDMNNQVEDHSKRFVMRPMESAGLASIKQSERLLH